MNELKLLSKRLGAVANLSAFSRKFKIAYRTLQRIRAGTKNATTSTVAAIERALDNEFKVHKKTI